MKKILIVTNIPSPYRVDLFEYIRTANDMSLDLYVVYQGKTERDRDWTIKNGERRDIFLKTKELYLKSFKYGKKTVYFQRGLGKILSNVSPDVVLICEYNPVAICAHIWCKVNGVPYISWTDGTFNFEKGLSIFQVIARRIIIQGASAYIASSSKSRENQLLYGAREADIFISQLTVDSDSIRHKKDKIGNSTFLYVGRLVNMKGVDLLIKAYGLVCKETTSFTELYIVGDGEDKKNLIELCKELKIDNRVHFEGFKEGKELIDYYRNCDVFILPSKSEPYGLVMEEAMCNSMPVICSKWADGHYDLIEEGINGNIVDPFDEELFAQVILKYINNQTMVEYMGKKSYERSLSYSIPDSAKQIVLSIEYVLKKGY